VGDDGDVANAWIQVENSSGLPFWGLLLLYYGEVDPDLWSEGWRFSCGYYYMVVY
jgi:hypothetical protein